LNVSDVLSYRTIRNDLEWRHRDKVGIHFLQATATTDSGSDPEKGWFFLWWQGAKPAWKKLGKGGAQLWQKVK
jgi:hypothetical protein